MSLNLIAEALAAKQSIEKRLAALEARVDVLEKKETKIENEVAECEHCTGDGHPR